MRHTQVQTCGLTGALHCTPEKIVHRFGAGDLRYDPIVTASARSNGYSGIDGRAGEFSAAQPMTAEKSIVVSTSGRSRRLMNGIRG